MLQLYLCWRPKQRLAMDIRIYEGSIIKDHVKNFENSLLENFSYKVEPPPFPLLHEKFSCKGVWKRFERESQIFNSTIIFENVFLRRAPSPSYTENFRVLNFRSFRSGPCSYCFILNRTLTTQNSQFRTLALLHCA